MNDCRSKQIVQGNKSEGGVRWHGKIAVGKGNLMAFRNFERQGAKGVGGEDIVAYVEPPATRSNEAFTEAFRRGKISKDKAQVSERLEAVDNYGDGSETSGNAVFRNLYRRNQRA